MVNLRRRLRFPSTSAIAALRILEGSGTSSDDEEAEVGSAGVEESPDPVVLEVAEAEADAFDEVVEGLGGPVGHLGKVVVADLVEPRPDDASQLSDLGGRRRSPSPCLGWGPVYSPNA